MAKAGCYVAVASLANAIMFFVIPTRYQRGCICDAKLLILSDLCKKIRDYFHYKINV